MCTVSITTPDADFAWDFGLPASSSYDESLYSNTKSLVGDVTVVGSLYHLCMMGWAWQNSPFVYAITPTATLDYESLQYPQILGSSYGKPTVNLDNQSATAYIGNIKVTATQSGDTYITKPTPKNSFLPTTLDTFNTTTANLPNIFEASTAQHIGYCCSGLFIVNYSSSQSPSTSVTSSPSIVQIDNEQIGILHRIPSGSFFITPIEEVKYD